VAYDQQRADSITQIAKLTEERDEAREWVRKLTSKECTLTCVYCGHAYPPGTPEHGSPVLTAHIEQCERHPMARLRAQLAAAEQQAKEPTLHEVLSANIIAAATAVRLACGLEDKSLEPSAEQLRVAALRCKDLGDALRVAVEQAKEQPGALRACVEAADRLRVATSRVGIVGGGAVDAYDSARAALKAIDDGVSPAPPERHE
jgi:hypothetical protein